MFDAVLTGGNAPQRKLGQGLVLTIAAHVVLAGFAVYVSVQPAKVVKKDTEVKFVAAHMAPPPPPPPPPPPAGGASKPKVEQQKKPIPVKKPETLVESKDKDKPKEEEKPKEAEKPKEDSAGQPGGVEGGVDGGVAGGQVGGQIGGVLGSTAPVPTAQPMTTMSYDSGSMTPPSLQSGSTAISYPREALEAKVEGKIIARCTITEDGRLVDCRIIKGLPFLDSVVLANLAARRYSPVMYQGHPQRVYYTFPFTFKMP